MPAAGDELLEEARSRARLVEVKGLRVEFAGEFFDRAGIDNGARVRREYLPGREILEKRLVHRMLLHRRRLFAPKLVRMQGGRRCAYLAISMKRTMRQPHARSAPSPACGGGVGRGCRCANLVCAPSLSLQPKSDISDFGQLMSGRTRVDPSSAASGRGDDVARFIAARALSTIE